MNVRLWAIYTNLIYLTQKLTLHLYISVRCTGRSLFMRPRDVSVHNLHFYPYRLIAKATKYSERRPNAPGRTLWPVQWSAHPPRTQLVKVTSTHAWIHRTYDWCQIERDRMCELDMTGAGSASIPVCFFNGIRETCPTIEKSNRQVQST